MTHSASRSAVLPPSDAYTVLRVRDNALIPTGGKDSRVQAIAATQKPIVIPQKLTPAEKTKVGTVAHKWVICRQLLIKELFSTKIKVSGSRAYQKGLKPWVDWLKALFLLTERTHTMQGSLKEHPLLNPVTHKPYSDAGVLFALILNDLEESSFNDVLCPVESPQIKTTKRKAPSPAGQKERAIAQLKIIRDALKSSNVEKAVNQELCPHLHALLMSAAELSGDSDVVHKRWSDMSTTYARWVRDVERGGWAIMETRGDDVMLRGRKQTGFDDKGGPKYTPITKRL